MGSGSKSAPSWPFGDFGVKWLRAGSVGSVLGFMSLVFMGSGFRVYAFGRVFGLIRLIEFLCL